MNWIDFVIIALLALALLHGWSQGAALQVLSVAGFWAGLFLGVLVAPTLAALAPNSARGIVAILVVLVAAMLFGALGDIVGSRGAHLLWRFRLRAVDQALGILVALAGTLVAVWLVGNILASSTTSGLGRALQQSEIVSALNRALPDVPSVFARIESFLSEHDFPIVFVNVPPGLLAPVAPPADPAVRSALAAAGPSTVKITGVACSSIVEGSGFVAAPQLVVTNAHVVAGDAHPRVLDASGAHAATPIGYDPRVDIAVLNVPGLSDRPLTLHAASVSRGTPAAALGYPQGSGLLATPAPINGLFDATGLDIYGSSLVTREIYTVNGTIRPGDSGGPLVSTGAAAIPSGTAIGVIFARSATNPGIGYALRMAAVEVDIARAKASRTPVSTGGCVR